MTSPKKYLEETQTKGVLSYADKDGHFVFSKNCDIVTLMALKTFIDYSIDKLVDEVAGASVNEKPKLNVFNKK